MVTSQQHFRDLIAGLTVELAGRPLDGDFDSWLNQQHGAGAASCEAIKTACQAVLATLPATTVH